MKRIYLYGVVMIGVVISCTLCLSPSEGQSEDVQSTLIAQIPQKTNFRESSLDDGAIRINWQQLGVSQEQEAHIRQKRWEFQQNVTSILWDLQRAEQALQLELMSDPVDRENIETMLSQISIVNQQLNEAAIQNFLAIKDLLTQAQREKLADLQNPLPQEFQGLQLDSQQRATVHEIIQHSRQHNREVTEELRTLQTELRDMLLAPQEVEKEHLKLIQASIAEKELMLEKARINMWLQIRELLTPEQKKQFTNFREEP
jgi:Spy/CpxP family protein refolding chaperone